LLLFDAPRPGFVLGAGGRRGAFSVRLEGAITLPSPVAVAGGNGLHIDAQHGALVPCAHPRWLVLCASVTVGRLGLSRAVTSIVADDTLFASVGARIGAELELGQTLRLRAQVEVAYLLTPRKFIDGGVTLARVEGLFVVPGLTAVILP